MTGFLYFMVVTISLIWFGACDVPGGQKNEENICTSPSSGSRTESLCIYIVVGFASGLTIVLMVGGVIICCIRVRQKCMSTRRTRLKTRKERPGWFHNSQENFNDLKDIEEHLSSGTYETVYDSETESTVHRTRCQKCGTIVSTGTLDNTTDKQQNSKTGVMKKTTDYTWKGLIDGKEEVINTELMVPPRRLSEEQNLQVSQIFDNEPFVSPYSELREVQEKFTVFTTADIERNHDPSAGL